MEDAQFDFLMESIDMFDEKTTDDEIVKLITENLTEESTETIKSFISEIAKNTNRAVINLRILHNDHFPANFLDITYSRHIIPWKRKAVLDIDGLSIVTYDKDRNSKPPVHSYVWNDFKVIAKYKLFEEQDKQYDFVLNGNTNFSFDFDEMKSKLSKNAFQSGKKRRLLVYC